MLEMNELLNFSKKIEKMSKTTKTDKVIDDVVKELGDLLLREVVKRTPVGKGETVTVLRWKNTKDGGVKVMKNKDGTAKTKVIKTKRGGTLKAKWKVSAVIRNGNSHCIIVFNNTHYAPYVEYGHRQTPGRYVPAIGKRLKKGFVPGLHMLRDSTAEVEKIAPVLIEKRLKVKLEAVFD